jgi:hypothetical protein
MNTPQPPTPPPSSLEGETSRPTRRGPKLPIAGPKIRRSAETVGGAAAIVCGWLIGDVAGMPMPDHVLQAFTILFMVAAARLGDSP